MKTKMIDIIYKSTDEIWTKIKIDLIKKKKLKVLWTVILMPHYRLYFLHYQNDNFFVVLCIYDKNTLF